MLETYQMYCFSVEIVPVSKDSVVCLSHKLTHHLGGISPLCLVQRMTNCIHLIDPATTQSKSSTILYSSESKFYTYTTKELFFFILVIGGKGAHCEKQIPIVQFTSPWPLSCNLYINIPHYELSKIYTHGNFVNISSLPHLICVLCQSVVPLFM